MSHEHPPYLQHHFDTPEQQFDAGKLGLWIFLATEILLFGGLFCAYAIYRANHPEIFVYAHQYLDKVLGGTNTVILLCSSLTMAWAVRASQLGQRKLLIGMLSLTLLGACGFLGIKYVEYKAKWEHGLLPGTHFAPHEHGEAAAKPAVAAPSATIKPSAEGPSGTVTQEAKTETIAHEKRPSNTQIFFGIYFLMTGLHGLHVLAGMGAIIWVLVRSIKGHFTPEYYTPVDFVGLYWHLVDLIWIFLFPLLYLIS
jgi:cytochrome c oxidase subunit 3